MDLAQITPIILTYNEEPNLERCLAGVSWAPHVLVVDSFSDDRTPSIAKRFSNVTLVQHTFETHAAQWEFARRHPSVRGEWILTLDADYVITEAFRRELEQVIPTPDLTSYTARFRYCIAGVPIRSGIYPEMHVLIRRESGEFYQLGHGHKFRSEGASGKLQARLHHDDRKSLTRWLQNQSGYAEIECHRITSPGAKLRPADKVRSWIFFMPWLILFYTLVLRLGLFDGWRGWVYAFERMIAESILSLRLVERHVLDPEVRRRAAGLERAA